SRGPVGCVCASRRDAATTSWVGRDSNPEPTPKTFGAALPNQSVDCNANTARRGFLFRFKAISTFRASAIDENFWQRATQALRQICECCDCFRDDVLRVDARDSLWSQC